MTEYSYELKIPRERVAVLIGKDGEVKKSIEEETSSKIKVDSKDGDIFVSGEDALGLYTAREVIKAVGRGFNPDIAKLLLKQDYVFEIVNLPNFAKSRESMLRLKGRVIGKDGKSRKLIEQLTESHICDSVSCSISFLDFPSFPITRPFSLSMDSLLFAKFGRLTISKT